MISGSYDPGEVYLFRGLGRGKFAAREAICDKTGKPILRVPNQTDPSESFGSWVTLVDWYDRGVLDVLVGALDGTMFLRRNEGTRTRPVYASDNEWVKVGTKRLRVPGEGHANPVIADWDGDGRWDIITGSVDGGVYWYRNVGKRGQPSFLPPIALIPKHEGSGYRELLDVGQEPKPGIRSQIAVVDYDQDSKLDVLLGDYCTYLHVKKDLTPQQREQFEDLFRRREQASKSLSASMDALKLRWREAMQGVSKSEQNSAENRAKREKLYEEMHASPAYQQQLAEYNGLKKELQRYVDPPTFKNAAPTCPTGSSGFSDESRSHAVIAAVRPGSTAMACRQNPRT